MALHTQPNFKPLLLHAFSTSPNPLKVAIALELTRVPYTIQIWQFGDDPTIGVKSAAFAQLSENQRVPVLVDSNNDITVWESGAIINYLRRLYDPAHVLGPRSSSSSSNGESTTSNSEGEISEHDRVDLEKWEYLLLTTAGPMTGQVAWFRYYHQPPNPDALKRYLAQVYRCYDVLEGQLKKSDGQSILPAGVSSVDCHWYPWLRQPEFLGLPQEGYPLIARWVKNMSERVEFRRAYERLQEAAEVVGTANADESGAVLSADPGLLKAIDQGTV